MLAKPVRDWFRAVAAFVLAVGLLDLIGPRGFDAAAAQQAVRIFYDLRLARRSLNCMLAPGLDRKTRELLAPTDPHPIAYCLMQSDNNGRLYRVQLILIHEGQAVSWHDVEEVQVVSAGDGQYLIAGVRRLARAAVAADGRDLIITEGRSVIGRVAIDRIPAVTVSTGQEIENGTAGFGPMVHNPWNPREIVFTIAGDRSRLATAIVRDGRPVIRTLGEVPGSMINRLLWLPIDDLVALESTRANGAKEVSIYRLGLTAEQVDAPWKERWSGSYSVRFLYFSGVEQALVLSVASPAGNEDAWAWRPRLNSLSRWQGTAGRPMPEAKSVFKD